MKIRKVRLKNFKRFDDLTIDLGDNPKKIVALVGPNGCGKSSIFDAFEEKLKNYKGAHRNPPPNFFSKLYYSILPDKKSEAYNRNEAVQIENNEGREFDKKSFYVRSPYRFTPSLNVTSITSQPDALEDVSRPGSSIDIDGRLKENYERLLGQAWNEYQYGSKSGPKMRAKLLGHINDIISKILDIRISNLGDVIGGKGQLYFEKESSKDFPFENLSSGEKEVVDIIIDLVVKTPTYNDTVFCIDEPELHLNTAIQRKLLIEVEKLIPDTCQLWVATHSVGFLRALQEELREKSQVLDFSRHDYFNKIQKIEPIRMTRGDWRRIFQTALEDITGLVSPRVIIYCEGKPQPNDSGEEQGLDALVYNQIFEEKLHDVLFISSGGTDVSSNLSLALAILSKAFNGVNIMQLRDRDGLSDTKRKDFLDKDSHRRILLRREIENYLFDKEVLKLFCLARNVTFNEHKYDSVVDGVELQDLKPIQQKIKEVCSFKGNIEEFKLKLTGFVLPKTNIYKELKECIFLPKEKKQIS
ncbi:MAG: ATP-binding protein [Patescibacteria group bacterium]|nr:ATP-binding protein [Patescibacteria group bacterium]